MRVKTESEEKGSFASVIFWAGMVVFLTHVLLYGTGCTVKIDNPFYAPSTLDVNKSTSTGAANYLTKDKKLTPGMATE